MILESFKNEFFNVKKIIDSLKTFDYDSITLYGSSYNNEIFINGMSDIDLIFMSKDFDALNFNNIINELKAMNLDFREKEPRIIIDNLCKRIEFYINFDRISFDITLCGGLIPSRESLIKNAWYDSFETLMGGVYINSKTLYGKIPDYDLFMKEFYPFYSDEIRDNRLFIIAKKLKLYNEKIKYNYDKKSNEMFDNLIKARKYFIKLLFIYYRKYYLSPETHILFQLDNCLNLDDNVKNCICFINGNVFEFAKEYLEISNQYLKKIL